MLRPLRPATTALLLAATAILASCGGGDADSAAGVGTPPSGQAPSASAQAPTTTPSSDAQAVDLAFARQMAVHHELAVEMAELAPPRAEHAELKALAAKIVTTQTRELTLLNAKATALGAQDGDAEDEMNADARTLGVSADDMGMDMGGAALEDADPFDLAFIDEMIHHHAGAVVMAKVQVQAGADAELKALAAEIVRTQEAEIAQLSSWRVDWYDGEPQGAGPQGAGDGAGAAGGHEGHGG